jgi:hypothetical protein
MRVTTHLRRKLAANGAKDLIRLGLTLVPHNPNLTASKKAA